MFAFGKRIGLHLIRRASATPSPRRGRQGVQYRSAAHHVRNGLAHSVSKDFAGAEIYIVGASIARPFSTVSSALSGRDDAINVSVQYKNASENTSSVAQARHLPLKGEGNMQAAPANE